MFGNRKNNKIKASSVSTIISQGTEIHGNISFTGGLHVDGIIKGNVIGDQTGTSILSLSELGVIEGEVRVPLVILNGSVLGNVFASERVELAPKSKVTGDVTYKLIEMVPGAEVNGRLMHKDESPDEMRIGSTVKLKADPPKKDREDNALSKP
ncbi:MAG: bactofilin family protein [Methylococcales bacterium]